MSITSAVEYSALPISVEGHSLSGLPPNSDPGNVSYHQEHLQNTGMKVAAVVRRNGSSTVREGVERTVIKSV
jgi:hypothetical protein